MRRKDAPGRKNPEKTPGEAEDRNPFEILEEEADRGPADPSVIEPATPTYETAATESKDERAILDELIARAVADTKDGQAAREEYRTRIATKSKKGQAAIEELRARDHDDVRDELYQDLCKASDIIEGSNMMATNRDLGKIYAKVVQAEAAGIAPHPEDQPMLDRLKTAMRKIPLSILPPSESKPVAAAEEVVEPATVPAPASTPEAPAAASTPEPVPEVITETFEEADAEPARVESAPEPVPAPEVEPTIEPEHVSAPEPAAESEREIAPGTHAEIFDGDETKFNHLVSDMIDNAMLDAMFDPDRSIDKFKFGLDTINAFVRDTGLALNPDVANRLENINRYTGSSGADRGGAAPAAAPAPASTPEAPAAASTPEPTSAPEPARVESAPEPVPAPEVEPTIEPEHVSAPEPVSEPIVEEEPIEFFEPEPDGGSTATPTPTESGPAAPTPAESGPARVESTPEPTPGEAVPEPTPGEAAPTPSDRGEAEPVGGTPEEGHDGGEKEPRSLKDVMNQGHDAMILALYNEEDQKNILSEALSIKAQKVSREHPLLTRLPFAIGRLIKAGMVARGSKEARQALAEGNYDKVYEALNLDERDKARSNILRTISDSVEERSRQALDEAGYTSERPVDKVTGVYDNQNRVERLDSEQETAAKEQLNNYFTRLEGGEDPALLDQEFDQNTQELFKDNPALATSFRTQRDRLKGYYDSGEFGLDAIHEFVDGTTLYMGKQHNSPYKVQKADGLVAATVAAGLAGGVTYALFTYAAQSGSRQAVSPWAGAVTGAVTGGVFGAISGWGRAGQRASEYELAKATEFAPDGAPAGGAAGEAPAGEGAAPEGETPEGEAGEEGEAAAAEAATGAAPEGGTPESDAEGADSAAAGAEAAGEGETPAGESAEATPTAAGATEVLEVHPEHPEARENILRRAYGGILKGLNRLDRAKRKYFYGEEKHFAKIEELRDRKDANALMEQFDNLMTEKREHPTVENIKALEDLYAEILARGQVSRDRKIDLVKFNNNQLTFDQKLREVGAELYGEDFDPSNIEAILDSDSDEFDGFKESYNKHHEIFLEKDKQANAELTKYKVRAAATDALVSAVSAAGMGALIQFGKAQLSNLFGAITGATSANGQPNVTELMDEANKPGGKGVSLEQDPDGGYSVKIGDQTVIGDGEQPGIDYNDDGTLTNDSISALEALGLTVQDNIGSRPAPNGGIHYDALEDFFNRANAGKNGLASISGRTWSDGDPVTIYDPVADGDGNITIQVVPNGYQGNIGDLDLYLSPGKSGMTAITVDIQPDGTAVIPAGSAASALFDGDQLLGRAEVGNLGSDGIAHILAVDGPGEAVGLGINVPSPNPITEIPVHEYTISDGTTTLSITTPPEIDAVASFTALNEGQPSLGLDEPNGLHYTDETITFRTDTGEVVELPKAEHYGGYQSITDTFNSVEKRSAGNSGTSIIDTLIERHTGQQVDGRSIEDTSAQFMEMVNSGEISEQEVVNEMLKDCTNSAERLVTLRMYLGAFEADLDGQGSTLIDTQEELNILANQLASGDPESYDNFANDTINLFYEKLSGGTMKFTQFAANSTQYTTWAQLRGEDIVQHVGKVEGNSTPGLGATFFDANGECVFDEETVRTVLNVPDNVELEVIAVNFPCGVQIRVQGRIVAQEEIERLVAERAQRARTTTTVRSATDTENVSATSENTTTAPTGEEEKIPVPPGKTPPDGEEEKIPVPPGKTPPDGEEEKIPVPPGKTPPDGEEEKIPVPPGKTPPDGEEEKIPVPPGKTPPDGEEEKIPVPPDTPESDSKTNTMVDTPHINKDPVTPERPPAEQTGGSGSAVDQTPDTQIEVPVDVDTKPQTPEAPAGEWYDSGTDTYDRGIEQGPGSQELAEPTIPEVETGDNIASAAPDSTVEQDTATDDAIMDMLG